jgi:hypothetical protein
MSRAPGRRYAGVAVALLLVPGVAGCATGVPLTAQTVNERKSTVAFESIDGPPPAVFQALVQKLTEEAQARRIPAVTREGSSDYRVRGYLAAHAERGRSAIAWVWDVYDAKGRRALRLEGQVPVADNAQNAWAAADATVLQRIAQAGMEQLGRFLAPAGDAVAAVEPESPRAAAADAPASSAIPLPPRRPVSAGRTTADAGTRLLTRA